MPEPIRVPSQVAPEVVAAHIHAVVEGLSASSVGQTILRAIWDAAPVRTPDASLPPLEPNGPRRKMLIEIEVSANFEHRLDNQWEVEREIHADRWSWQWKAEQ